MSKIEIPDPNLLQILHYPAPELRVNAEPIGEPEGELEELGRRMKELMLEGKGIGLAATQVGWPRRLLVTTLTGDPKDAEVFIDPVIVKRSGRISDEEGCLSVPGVRARLKRAETVLVRATRLSGETVEIEAEAYLARAWQHEIDHLDGMLFVDKVGPAARIMITRQLRHLEDIFRGREKE